MVEVGMCFAPLFCMSLLLIHRGWLEVGMRTAVFSGLTIHVDAFTIAGGLVTLFLQIHSNLQALRLLAHCRSCLFLLTSASGYVASVVCNPWPLSKACSVLNGRCSAPSSLSTVMGVEVLVVCASCVGVALLAMFVSARNEERKCFMIKRY